MAKPDKRDEIIRAALMLMTEQGFHGAPMAQIAERAGVAAGTIYRYFESRDVLIMEIYKKLEKIIRQFIESKYDPAAPFRARFMHLGTSILSYFTQNPKIFRYMEQFHSSPYGAAHRQDTILSDSEDGCNIFKDLFEQGLQQQVIKPLPMIVLFALAFGPITNLARDHILGFVHMDEILIQQTIDACWDAIKR